MPEGNIASTGLRQLKTSMAQPFLCAGRENKVK
jgi:hypothetical protein